MEITTLLNEHYGEYVLGATVHRVPYLVLKKAPTKYHEEGADRADKNDKRKCDALYAFNQNTSQWQQLGLFSVVESPGKEIGMKDSLSELSNG